MRDLSYSIKIEPQPNETTCGPTCLHGIYSYHGEKFQLDEIIKSVKTTIGGGTLGVHLSIDALKRGYKVTTYTHNLNVFDPSWFSLSPSALKEKLHAQTETGKELKTIEASKHYAEYLDLGGRLSFSPLVPEFIVSLLRHSGPVICGLSATYLYMSQRERNDNFKYDDIHGEPQGHFVVLSGVKGKGTGVQVLDPLETNPFKAGSSYTVDIQHLINSILIGVITYDANIIAIEKRSPS